MEEKKELAKVTRVEEIALAKINDYMNLGMTIPAGFNPTNSLKKARLMLNDMVVNGKPLLEVCTKESIVQCLIESCMDGLDYQDRQIYFIPRANKLTNLESVYGRIARAQRASPNYKPIVCYVHEGDIFDFGADLETGYTKVKKHETSLENLDKPFIAAYAYVTDCDGNTEVFVMAKREWLSSWKKSSNGAIVSKEFERDMIFRTIVKKSTKALVNASKQSYVSTFVDDDDTPLAGNVAPVIETKKSFTDFEEVPTTEAVDLETGEIKPEPKKQGRPVKEAADKPKEEVKAEAPVAKDEDDF